MIGRDRLALPGVALATLAACGGGAGAPPQVALSAIETEGLAEATRVLSSDAFEGRAPASEGERKTIAYLRERFQGLGLEPGNGESWLQEVPLVSITADPGMTLRIGGDGDPLELAYGTDFIAWTKRVIDRVAIEESELVFAGYGIVAPEYDWNDYEGLDVEGKAVVLLVNDPGYATGDSTLFDGRAMTYYGRWTYKYEEAARQGAAAAILVHETGAAGYPWDVVRGSWSGPQFGLVVEDANLSRVAVEGWITTDVARRLFERAGQDYDEAAARAATREFEPIPLEGRASLAIANRIERSTSNNVLARLPGAERPEEAVIYMAHWDHFGRDPSLEGDQIYNGALDNATGTAGLLEVAEAFAALPGPPERSVLFLAVTAEEQGLLGSAHYVEHPVVPLEETVAAINMDGLNIWGPMRDITVVGWGASELDDLLRSAATEQDRAIRPDPEPEKGFYYRSDHFNFARHGVPALYADAGIDHVQHGQRWTMRQRERYTAERYHKPSDEFDEDWDLRGAVDDLRLLFRVGHRLARSDAWPEWREGSEFRAIRDSMMAGRDRRTAGRD